MKPLIIKTNLFDSMKFPYITRLKYCQKMDFAADPINKIKTLIIIIIILIIIIINSLFDFKINEISLYNAIEILPKIGFRSGPYQ